MRCRIRRAEAADYREACGLWAEADGLHAQEHSDRFRSTDQSARSRGLFDAHLGDAEQALSVAEVDGEVVGLVRVQAFERLEVPDVPALAPRRFAMVQELVVAEAHRRRGIGTRLMREAERWARDRGVTEVGLSVYEFNQAALRLYHRLGYSTDRQPPTRPQARLRGHRCVEWITGYRLRSAPMTSVHCGPLAVGAALRCRLRCGCPRGIRIHRAISRMQRLPRDRCLPHLVMIV